MAKSATIVVPDTAVTEQTVNAILTITNDVAYPVTIKNVVPFVQPTGGVNPTVSSGVSIGPINFGPNANVTLPASSTLVMSFSLTFHAPSTGILSSGSLTYDVGATCYTDTEVFAPTPDTIEVDYVVTYDASQQ